MGRWFGGRIVGTDGQLGERNEKTEILENWRYE